MSSYDGIEQIQRRERYIEFLGRFKEKKEGNGKEMDMMKEEFSAEYGIKPETAQHYIDSYKRLGFLKVTYGNKRWRYIGTPEREERIFGIIL